MKNKISLEEATMKALLGELDKPEDNVEGIVDGVMVVTDPDITPEEYEEVIDKAKEIIEDTPEGEVPFNEEYVGEYLMSCPICGTTFTSKDVLNVGDSCPVCTEIPEQGFVLQGQIATQTDVELQNDIKDAEETVDEELEEVIPEEEQEAEAVSEEDAEEAQDELLASEEVRTSDNKLEEAKDENNESEKLTETSNENIYVITGNDTIFDIDAPINNKKISKVVIKDKGGKGPNGESLALIKYIGSKEDLRKEFSEYSDSEFDDLVEKATEEDIALMNKDRKKLDMQKRIDRLQAKLDKMDLEESKKLTEDSYNKGIFNEIEQALAEANLDPIRFIDGGVLTKNIGWTVRSSETGESQQITCDGSWYDENLEESKKCESVDAQTTLFELVQERIDNYSDESKEELHLNELDDEDINSIVSRILGKQDFEYLIMDEIEDFAKNKLAIDKEEEGKEMCTTCQKDEEWEELKEACDKKEEVVPAVPGSEVKKAEEISFQEISDLMSNAEDYSELYDAASKIVDAGLREEVNELIGQCEVDEDEVEVAYSIVTSDLIDPKLNDKNI